ncbi:MAG: murE [Gammaproteobacteria bacterium]|jgi:UDP-N-acetylmuramoyl-L-alanyl-D-glutamate--2,6-diaminopimelate ligase|nr:murE [Gammaproteobacteria bacterium]
MIKLSDLMEEIKEPIYPNDLLISGLALDSRQVQKGDLFFAYQGSTLDGRQFINEAIKKGAKAIMVERDEQVASISFQDDVPIISVQHLKHKISALAGRFYNHPAQSMQIIGVTGTSGKTSFTYFLASVLEQLAFSCGVIGTMGNGLYGDIKSGNLTTPDAIAVQKIFAELFQQGARYVAMEVSSHSLAQGRVEAVPFTVGVFTNLTQDHLDYHGTMKAYGVAKKRLFESLATQFAVINNDDPFGRELIASLPNKENIIAYGIQKSKRVESVIAQSVELEQGVKARVITPWGEGELQTQLIGHFNLSNLLAVLAVIGLLKIPLSAALQCLKNVLPVPGRMQVLGGKELPLVVVDYSHKPDALKKALEALRPYYSGQLYCVFGCGGERDRGKRPLMGAIAERYADRVIVTDDNPRTEDPKQIVADIMQGFVHPEKIIVEHDRSKAINNSIQYAKRGDCVLIAGKGAETYQQIGNIKIPFSDVEQVRERLNVRLAE